MDRREFIGAVVALIGAAALGGIGGATAKENGSWGESEEDEPPSRKEAS